MEVLVFLIEHAGQVVSRDEIQDRIWGEVIVGQESLTNAIIKIRKVFQDDARNPAFVETIPKRGYRFIAPVVRINGAAPNHTLTYSKRKLLIAGAAFIAAIIVALSFTYFWSQPGASQHSTGEPAAFAPQDRTVIAVGRFVNLSGKSADEYLSRGIEDSLLTDLAQLPGLSVIRLAKDAAAMPHKYQVEGSILLSGDRIRIVVRLISADDGTVLWSQLYDRPFSNLITVEDEIRIALVDKLALKVSRAVLKSRARGYTESIAAYDLFLRARQALLPRDKAGNDCARTLYFKAIERDPHFARAYAGLALTYAAEYRNSWVDDRQTALAKAQKMAETALGIAPDLPEQYWVIGYVKTQQRQFDAAEAALAKALDLNPDYADAYALLGGIKTYRGEPAATVPLLRQAVQLNADAGYLYYLLLGRAYYFLGNCSQAEINLKEALARNSVNLESHLYHIACLVRQGNTDDAKWEVEEVLAIEAAFSVESWLLTYPMSDPSQKLMLLADLHFAGLD
jgi:TolB-like protein